VTGAFARAPTTKGFCKGVETGELVGLKTLDEAVDELNTVLQFNEAY
jgi:hypothetical protein